MTEKRFNVKIILNNIDSIRVELSVAKDSWFSEVSLEGLTT